MATDAQWVSASLGLPDGVSEAVSSVGSVLETVSSLLELAAGILDIIKVFVVDIESPLVAVVDALLAIVQDLLEDFQQSGLYLYADGPRTPADDPNIKYFGQNLQGGMDGWRTRMAAAFYNPNDPNRPQFSNSASIASIHLLVTSGSIGELGAKTGFLFNLLGSKMNPVYEPPRNLEARCINSEYYERFYDTDTGLFSQAKLEAFDFTTSGLDTVEAVRRYDMVSGDEIIVDRNTGIVLASANNYDAVLLTWKVDPNMIPNAFQVWRSETKGGEVSTLSEQDPRTGETLVSNVVETDLHGRVITSYETVIDVEPATIVGSLVGQYAYLDTTVDATKTYYYRVVSLLGDAGVNFTVPDLNLAIPVVRNINSFLQSLEYVLRGQSDPSEEVSVYVPDDSDVNVLYDLYLKSVEDTQRPWQTGFGTTVGWQRVSIATLAQPLDVAMDELRNFVEALQASIQSGAAEIVAFIELMQAKINTINTFIEILQALIALLEAIEVVSFNCLTVSSDNGLSGVLGAIQDDGLPNVPAAGANDYVSSLTILGGTAGAGGALAALQVLFGIGSSE